MAILEMKWILIAGVIAAILLVLYFTGHKTVHTELVIPASPDKVWAVLMDTPGYAEWNPVLVPAAEELREGAKIQYRMIQPDGKQSPVESTVREIVEDKKLYQFGGMRGILTFHHTYSLEEVPGGTRVTQHEEYYGIWVNFWDASWVEPAYETVNLALSERVGSQGVVEP